VVRLDFQMFVDDWSVGGTIVNPAGLTIFAGPNQHARVDLLGPGFPPLHTGPGVVRNFYIGADPGPPPNPWRSYSFDLTGIALPGSTYTIRFAAVETQFYLHMGVDNVRIIAGEECDDGNNIGGDGCSPRCLDECGSGIVNPREECDPPGLLAGGSNCCVVHAGGGCTDPVCEDFVCDQNPACCGAGWGPACQALAAGSPMCVSGCQSISKCTLACCIDLDGDGDCNVVDNCPLTPNSGGGTALFDYPLIATNNTTLAWQRPEHVQWVKGNLSVVSTYTEFGGGIGPFATTIGIPDVPAVGTGIWWVLKPDCPVGSWSTGSPSECLMPGCPPGGRDAHLPPF
jgi:cysteine-rich repeat protein